MKKPLELALVAAGRHRRCPVTRLRNLAEHLGPVKAPTYRQASRLANTMRAGYPVHHYEDFARCRVILICVPEERLPGVVSGMVGAPLDWKGKIVLVCNGPLDAAALSELAARGAATASMNCIDDSDELRFLVEGDRLAVRAARRFLEEGGAKALEVHQSTQHLCELGASFASTLLIPLVDASVTCLRQAGLTPRQAGLTAERAFQKALRAYLKGGRRAWKGPRSLQSRRALLQQLESLRAADPELAGFFAETAARSLRYLGHDTAWLEEAMPPARRAAAAGE